jgi:hypothetical protein
MALTPWADAILPPDVRNWFEQQHWLIRFGIFCALGMAIWMVAYAIVVQIVAPLHFALEVLTRTLVDPQFALQTVADHDGSRGPGSLGAGKAITLPRTSST